jgi:hypothetical protein
MMPTAVAVAPEVGSLDRARMDLMKSAPVGPNSLPSSSLIAARAASCPNARPATATTIRSTGARDVAA